MLAAPLPAPPAVAQEGNAGDRDSAAAARAGGPADSDGPVLLRLRTERGERLRYRFETTTSVTPPPQLGPPTRMRSDMRLARTTLAAGPDTLLFRAKIEELELAIEGAGGGMGEQLRRMAERGRKRTQGAAFEMTVTRTGRIAGMTLGRRTRVGSDQITRSIRQLAFAALPAGSVSVGDSWSTGYRTDARAFNIPVPGEVVTENRITLRRLLSSGEGTVAELQVESSFRFVPASVPEGGRGTAVTLDGAGARSLRFDVDRGRFLSASGTQSLTVEMGVPGMPGGGGAIQLEIESDARLLED